MFVDNLSSIRLVKNSEYHKRTKHIDTRYHFIREKVNNKEIIIDYVPTEIQKADIFTKALPRDRFKNFCDMINVGSKQKRRSNGGSVGVIHS